MEKAHTMGHLVAAGFVGVEGACDSLSFASVDAAQVFPLTTRGSNMRFAGFSLYSPLGLLGWAKVPVRGVPVLLKAPCSQKRTVEEVSPSYRYSAIHKKPHTEAYYPFAVLPCTLTVVLVNGDARGAELAGRRAGLAERRDDILTPFGCPGSGRVPVERNGARGCRSASSPAGGPLSQLLQAERSDLKTGESAPWLQPERARTALSLRKNARL